MRDLRPENRDMATEVYLCFWLFIAGLSGLFACGGKTQRKGQFLGNGNCLLLPAVRESRNDDDSVQKRYAFWLR